MKRKLLISGEVHDVGYRPFLLGIAESLEIERFFADNIKLNGKKAVLVLIDSSPEKVENFIQIAKTHHPEHARVESITVEDYKGNVMKIENYYRYLSAMQLSKIATYGKFMLIKQDEMLNKQDETIAEIKKIHEKQDITISEIRNVRESVDGVSSRLDKTNNLLEERFYRMENEIERIKKALIRAGIEV